MKLLLTSDGLRNDAIASALQQLIGRPFDQVSVAFVPTAANLEEGDKGWLIDDMARFRAQGFAPIDIVDISAIPDDVALERLAAAQVLVFGGGDSYYLMSWIERCGLHHQLGDLLASRIYVGISAGSIASGPHLQLASESSLWSFISEDRDRDPLRAGLGLVDFYFRPHLNSADFPTSQEPALERVADSLGKPAYAVDDESALVVIDGAVEIVGTGKVLKYGPF